MARRYTYAGGGMPFMGGGHFTPGCWRPDKPGGTVAIPEGPRQPIVRPEEPERLKDGRLRDPRTASNLAAKSEALAVRRWKPQEPN